MVLSYARQLPRCAVLHALCCGTRYRFALSWSALLRSIACHSRLLSYLVLHCAALPRPAGPALPWPALPCPALPCRGLPFPAVACPFLPCPALPCPALPCLPALPCPALPCPALPCPALPCPALPCPALPCPALPLPCPAPYIVVSGPALCRATLHHAIRYCGA